MIKIRFCGLLVLLVLNPVVNFFKANDLLAGDALKFNLSSVPFSYYGSYMAVSTRVPENMGYEPGLFIHDLSGKNMWKSNAVFRIDLLQNNSNIKYQESATASLITLTDDQGGICEISFESKDILRFRYKNMGVRVTCLQKNFPYSYNLKQGQWLIPNFVITTLKGDASQGFTDQEFQLFTFTGDPEGSGEFAVEFYETGWQNREYVKPFDECTAQSEQIVRQWLSGYPSCSEKYRQARDLALYINWSCVVSPRDNMTRYGMLMSKNWMQSIWSWDNCFNALATAYADPDLAWQQIQVVFDHQNETGALPDALTDHDNVWAFVKPPVYGIMLENLLQRNIIPTNSLPDVYLQLSKLTRFWFQYRDMNQNGVPEYFHGNDSGWDNATMFDTGFPCESADLCSFLVYQMDFLAVLAKKLNKPADASYWTEKSDKLLQYMLAELWIDNHFVSKNILTGSWNDKSKSLLSYIPVVLADRLPAEYRKELIEGLKKSGNFNQNGLATENPESELYVADGYWRGPIWAPTTYLIASGLRKCGEEELAADIASRYCDLCIRNGFPENFNAVTGEPLRDKAYTWTSSVFILLLNEFMTNR